MKVRQRLNVKDSRKGFIAMLLALIGIGSTSCDEIASILGGGMMCMYGTPTAEYSVKGKVSDEKGKGLEGIRVVVKGEIGEREGVVLDEAADACFLDTLATDGNGKFSLERTGFPADRVIIKCQDIDGPANGGEFKSNALVIDKLEYKGKQGAWIIGKVEITDADVILEEKE